MDTRTADGAADGAADRAAVRAGTTPKPPRGERRALVLGGGGVLGFAWMVGALTVLKEETGWDPRDASHLVGTSAGAVLAATLACHSAGSIRNRGWPFLTASFGETYTSFTSPPNSGAICTT